MTEEEQRALEAVRKWIRSGGPGVRVLKILLRMAERAESGSAAKAKGEGDGYHEDS